MKKNLLTPKLSLRYSPNDTKNLKDETRLLTSDNIFSSNRLDLVKQLKVEVH